MASISIEYTSDTSYTVSVTGMTEGQKYHVFTDDLSTDGSITGYVCRYSQTASATYWSSRYSTSSTYSWFTRHAYLYCTGTTATSHSVGVTYTASQLPTGYTGFWSAFDEWEGGGTTNYACYFYPNGGTPTSAQTEWVASGGYITMTSFSNNVSRTYYTLDGWLDDDSGTVYSTTATVGPIYGVKYFYAQWEKTSSTIRLDANGGSFSNGSTVYRIVDTVGDRVYFTSYSQSVSRSGYKLLGWSLSNTATSATYPTDSYITVSSSDATYYAVWEKKEIALFYWSSATADAALIAKGKLITNITATRWNNLKAKIRELRLAQGNSWTYSTVSKGAAMTASEFNTVRTAISNCGGYATLPAAQASGNAVKAALFEGDGSLKSALNGAITYYNNN